MSKPAFVAAALLALGLTAPATACGVRDVCADVTASLGGVFTSTAFAPPASDAVELTWWTDREPDRLSGGVISTALTAYRVSRCRRTDCIPLAQLQPVGSCGAIQRYGLLDQPPPPADDWFYRVELVLADGTAACPVDVTPK